MEEVARGGGELKFAQSGDVRLAILTAAMDSGGEPGRGLGVSSRVPSVVGISESCDGWWNSAWESILPKAGLAKRYATRRECR